MIIVGWVTTGLFDFELVRVTSARTMEELVGMGSLHGMEGISVSMSRTSKRFFVDTGEGLSLADLFPAGWGSSAGVFLDVRGRFGRGFVSVEPFDLPLEVVICKAGQSDRFLSKVGQTVLLFFDLTVVHGDFSPGILGTILSEKQKAPFATVRVALTLAMDRCVLDMLFTLDS